MSTQPLTLKKVNNIMYNVGTVLPNGNEQGSKNMPIILNNYSSNLNVLEAIDSEAMRERGIIVLNSRIQLIHQKYRDKTTLASKTRFSRHCFGFQSRRFLLLVGYNI